MIKVWNLDFPKWLDAKYKIGINYADNQYGDLAKGIWFAIRDNPFDEDFNEYDSLDDWLDHLETHGAPEIAFTTMREVWAQYEKEFQIS